MTDGAPLALVTGKLSLVPSSSVGERVEDGRKTTEHPEGPVPALLCLDGLLGEVVS